MHGRVVPAGDKNAFKRELKDEYNKEQFTHFLDDSSNIWQIKFVLKGWPTFAANYPVQLLSSTGCHVGIGWNKSKEPLDNARSLIRENGLDIITWQMLIAY